MPYAKACSRHEQPIAMQSYDKYFRKTTRFVIIFLGGSGGVFGEAVEVFGEGAEAVVA